MSLDRLKPLTKNTYASMSDEQKASALKEIRNQLIGRIEEIDSLSAHFERDAHTQVMKAWIASRLFTNDETRWAEPESEIEKLSEMVDKLIDERIDLEHILGEVDLRLSNLQGATAQ